MKLRYVEDSQELTVITDTAYYKYSFVSPEWYEVLAKTVRGHKPNNIWKILNKPAWKSRCVKTERITCKE